MAFAVGRADRRGRMQTDGIDQRPLGDRAGRGAALRWRVERPLA